jgi:glycosyltransferase involved in cell wall biosynthesis
MKTVAVLYSGGRQWGGIETYLANLLRLYDRSRVELALISMGEWDLTRALRQEGLADAMRILPGKRLSPRTILRLRRIIKSEHPGLLVSQGTVANAYARLAVTGTGVPNLTVVHSNMVLDYPRTTRWAFTLSDRVLRGLTAKYIAVSRDLKEKLVKSGVDADKVTVIYNGVSTAGRIPAAACVPSKNDVSKHVGTVSLASVGRLHPVKNFDGLIMAMQHLPAHVSLTIWGDGAEKANLLALVERLGLHDRVRLAGESQTMGEALEGVDIYIQPSRSEGCSFAVAEAMLYGKPVVVTPCGGLPEQVDAGETGVVARDCSPDGLARAIAPLVESDSLAARLGEAGRLAALDKFSMQKWLTETTQALCDTAVGGT